jgi:AraC-like DNA-binding protein
MPRAHRHDGIEVHHSGAGAMTYLFGGAHVHVPAGTTAVFWSSVPHQLVEVTPGATFWWLTVPLAAFLRWGLPQAAVGSLLRGVPLLVPAADGDDPSGRYARWSADLATGDPGLRAVTLLEAEAHVRRLAHASGPAAEAEPAPVGDVRVAHATAMARHLALSFARPLSVADLAAVVHLHPTYAAEVFRDVLGTTPAAYLTQRRIAEAQRLLLTTDATVVDVAHAAGFGSVSRFYASFAAGCGRSPAAYRRQYRSLHREG